MSRSFVTGLVVVLWCSLCSVPLRGREKPPAKESDAANPAEATAREHLQQALLAETLGDNAQRVARLKTAAETMPALKEAQWNLGRVESKGKWQALAEAEAAAKNDPNQIEYRALRDEAHNPKLVLNLARWCLKNGWVNESRLHFAQLLINADSPKAMRDEAIKRLDMHYVNGAWITRTELEASENKSAAVQAAFEKWRPRLIMLRDAINENGFKKRDQAIARFHQFQDDAIVPALESFVFDGGDRFSEEVVHRLSKNSTEDATVALTRFAIFSEFVAARDAAMEGLRNRPLHDYIPLLLSGLAAPIQSEHRVTTTESGTVSYVHVLTREMPTARQIAISGHVARAVELPSTLPNTPGLRNTIRESLYSEQLNSVTNAAQDVELKAYLANLQLKPLNNRVFAALEQTTNQHLPREPQAWWQWWQEYNETYWPKPTQYVWGMTEHTYEVPRQMSCFLAGTPVRTQVGFAAIETIQPGDRVLAQDQDTGELAYKLVLRTTLRPPADMLKITAGSETIVTTLGHPFWVSGQGWRMAKQLKVGDLLHSVDGAIRIDAVEPSAQQPAHNLVVADFNSYFVGNQCLLVHDNEYRKPTRCIVPGLIADEARE